MFRNMRHHAPAARRPSLPRWMLAWLLLALCWTPLWTKLHQTVHAAPMHASGWVVVQPAAALLDGAEQTATWGDLHGHTALECAVLDQLAHGFAPAPELAVALSAQAASVFVIPSQRPAPGVWRFVPEARAPPVAQQVV